MTNPHPPHLPRTRVPPWERRRGAEKWKWNGSRRGDPRLPQLTPGMEWNPRRVLGYAMVASLVGFTLLLMALH